MNQPQSMLSGLVRLNALVVTAAQIESADSRVSRAESAFRLDQLLHRAYFA
jgi:hypothetical protein